MCPTGTFWPSTVLLNFSKNSTQTPTAWTIKDFPFKTASHETVSLSIEIEPLKSRRTETQDKRIAKPKKLRSAFQQYENLYILASPYYLCSVKSRLVLIPLLALKRITFWGFFINRQIFIKGVTSRAEVKDLWMNIVSLMLSLIFYLIKYFK